jgi:hypothetical protein
LVDEKRMSLITTDDKDDWSSEEQGLTYFEENYLDGDMLINGNIWSLVLPQKEEVINSNQ